MEPRKLEEVVREFRSALQELAGSGFHFCSEVSLANDFPHACCDDSSHLLAAYLTDQGFPGAIRIHGRHGGRDGELVTHVWLELNGKIIDITGDQFCRRGYNQPEILITDNDDFLSTFNIDPDPQLADYRLTNIPQFGFRHAYEAVIKIINSKP